MREAKLRPKNLKERNFVYLDDALHGRLCRGSLSSVMNNTSRKNFRSNCQLKTAQKEDIYWPVVSCFAVYSAVNLQALVSSVHDEQDSETTGSYNIDQKIHEIR